MKVKSKRFIGQNASNLLAKMLQLFLRFFSSSTFHLAHSFAIF